MISPESVTIGEDEAASSLELSLSAERGKSPKETAPDFPSAGGQLKGSVRPPVVSSTTGGAGMHLEVEVEVHAGETTAPPAPPSLEAPATPPTPNNGFVSYV